eukprot:Gb_10014 [translate_table: standard]
MARSIIWFTALILAVLGLCCNKGSSKHLRMGMDHIDHQGFGSSEEFVANTERQKQTMGQADMSGVLQRRVSFASAIEGRKALQFHVDYTDPKPNPDPMPPGPPLP